MTIQRRWPRTGDRVYSPFFGLGTMQKLYYGDSYGLVLWDVAPPRDYNLGNNPCVIRREELQRPPGETDGH